MKITIQDTFDQVSDKYNSQRRKLIPCFDDFYGISAAAANTSTPCPEILDIGAGTGLLSSLLLKKYPQANLTLVDISRKMLEMAQIRFKDYPNVKYLIEDYCCYPFSESYDIIVSALSIHHLSHALKEELFKKCFSLLKPGGVFINSDQIITGSPFIDDFYKNSWKTFIENGDLTADEISACYERMKFDNECTLAEQLSWLKEAGFKDVDCLYKYLNFAVIFGRKVP